MTRHDTHSIRTSVVALLIAASVSAPVVAVSAQATPVVPTPTAEVDDLTEAQIEALVQLLIDILLEILADLQG